MFHVEHYCKSQLVLQAVFCRIKNRRCNPDIGDIASCQDAVEIGTDMALSKGGPEARSRPPGLRKRRASGVRASSAPAARISTASNPSSNVWNSLIKTSARPVRIWTSSRPSSLTTAARKEVRRRRASISVRVYWGWTIFRGIPGIPAPDPKSRMRRIGGGRKRRKSKESRKSFSRISPGLR